MNYISLFSGIEAATLAWAHLGWKPIAFAEIDPFCSSLLSRYYSHVPNHGDVKSFDWSIYRRKVDVLVGGPPCQDYSLAGSRRSLEGDRGQLSVEYVRCADAIDPRYVVAEQVPGWLSARHNAFGCFLSRLVGARTEIVSGAATGRWPRAGLVVGPRRAAAWRVLNAEYFGVPQQRHRVYVVAERDSQGDGPAEVLFEPESVPRDTAPERKEGEEVSGTLSPGAHPGSYNGQDAYTGHLIIAGNSRRERSTSTPLTASGCRMDYTYETFIADQHRIRRLMPLEWERLQGFPDNFTASSSDAARYKAIGNSMAVPVMRWIGERLAAVAGG